MKKIRKMMAILIVAVLTLMMVPATVFAANLGRLTLNFTFTGAPEGQTFRFTIGGADYATNATSKTYTGVDGSSVYVDPLTVEAAEAAVKGSDIVTVRDIDGYDKEVNVTVNSLDASTKDAEVTYNVAYTPSQGSGSGNGGSAATPGTGSITINNATVGQTYTIYKLFDANPTSDGTSVAYTASPAVYNWLNSNNTASTLFEFTQNVEGTYNVTKKSGVDDDDVIDFLNSLITETTTNGNTVTTVDSNLAALRVEQPTAATSATLTFAGIPYGYYLVQSSLGAVVTVDTTTPDVTIIDKNQSGPDWDIDEDHTGKAFTDANYNILTQTTGEGAQAVTTTVTDNSANYGDTLHYVIGVNTTNYDGEDKITSYFIQDTIASGLTYDTNSIVVKVGDTPLTTDDYSITYTQDNHGFEITIPWYVSDAFKYASPNTIKVYYDATVTDTAALAGQGNKNTANFTYQKEDEQDKEPYDTQNKKSTTTYVYALGILKVATNPEIANAETPANIPLAGATFELKDSSNNPVYVVAENNNPGVYKLDTSTPATPDTRSNVVVTPDSGIIIVKGLEAGIYTLTETDAPAGYNVLPSDVTVTASIAQTNTYTTTIRTYYDEDGHVVAQEDQDGATTTETTSVNVVPITVENQKGVELPSTGGIGTTIFYILGAILVIGGGVVLVTRRRIG